MFWFLFLHSRPYPKWFRLTRYESHRQWLQGFPTAWKTKETENTDVFALMLQSGGRIFRCLWNANFLSQFSSLFWISAQWANTFLDSKTSREPDGWEELGKRTHTVWKRYEFLTLHLAKTLWKLEEWYHFWFVQMHAIPELFVEGK